MAYSRRTFIKAGALGGAALAAAAAWEGWRVSAGSRDDGNDLSPAGRDLFAAILPALLAGAIAPRAWTPPIMDRTLLGVATTVRNLSPAARAELRQLFALLDQRPLRFALAGVWAPWPAVDVTQARRFLDRWRDSSTPMLASAYQALHDIALASWYADPTHWPDTGYPGPPKLGGSPA